MVLPPKRCFSFRKMSILETCSSSCSIDSSKSGGCGANEPPRLCDNRRFFRQIRKRKPKTLRLRRASPATLPPGRVRVPLLPTLQESISVPIAGIGGLEKILTLFENFTPPFPEKEVKRDKWVQPKENYSCVAP
jgi:hypothetical protein